MTDTPLPGKLGAIAGPVHDLIEEALGGRPPFMLLTFDALGAQYVYDGARDDYIAPLKRILRTWEREQKRGKRRGLN